MTPTTHALRSSALHARGPHTSPNTATRDKSNTNTPSACGIHFSGAAGNVEMTLALLARTLRAFLLARPRLGDAACARSKLCVLCHCGTPGTLGDRVGMDTGLVAVWRRR